MSDSPARTRIRELYFGNSPRAVKFRYGLLAFDVLMLLFLFISSFHYGKDIVELMDVLFGAVILADLAARLWISTHRLRLILSLPGAADILVVISLLLPLLGENLAFLRVLRTLRLFRSYRMVDRLREDFEFFRHYEDIIASVVNLLVFIFIMTALVFETQIHSNPAVGNYLDALYFTVTALTTTGFGDVTLTGDSGKLLSVAIMIFGVSLFIRLIQTVFRLHKVRFVCKNCGLFLHDRDAIHCKHCGNHLNIPTEGIS